ncbi:hypothetical protein [Lactobacillus bombicola]|uniref:hypothetical protein n=1 Tax=Lactobacillus bombicola TaxID=1505723 RepID=UPI0013563FA4|nr:hypothetical protein [Lactobacillus bombicola]
MPYLCASSVRAREGGGGLRLLPAVRLLNAPQGAKQKKLAQFLLNSILAKLRNV